MNRRPRSRRLRSFYRVWHRDSSRCGPPHEARQHRTHGQTLYELLSAGYHREERRDQSRSIVGQVALRALDPSDGRTGLSPSE